MYSSEEMEKVGEDLGKRLLQVASHKTIVCGFICFNIAIVGAIFYLLK